MLSSKVLYVPSGSIHKIIAYLSDENPEISPLDGFLLRFVGQPQQGWIDLQSRRVTHGDFLYRLSHSKAAMKPVTLIPGETTFFFFQQLAESHDFESAKLHSALNAQSPYKEGAFVPDTYQLPVGISEQKAVALLLSFSRTKHRKWSQKIFGSYNEHKWRNYIRIASVIQKEAADAEEMPLISSVIANRLAKGMKLQMDGTLNYGPYSHTAVTAKRIRSDRSRYNTYLYKGVPPEPVCNVGFEAIRAAIFPSKSKYLYFTKGSDGKHRFTRYYSTHKRNILRVTK
ncbi:MAG TPA: endolytic transglycosylase MltG [Sulfuricurvum sp.]|nr:endolytic transglycosylase MltG [Sulfuricurvum sp.]